MENYYKTISKINNEISNSKHFRNLNNLFIENNSLFNETDVIFCERSYKILKGLEREGLVDNIKIVKKMNKKKLLFNITTLCWPNIENNLRWKIKNISLPSRKIYIKVNELKKFSSLFENLENKKNKKIGNPLKFGNKTTDLDIYYIETSKGIMSHNEAIYNNIGGEFLFKIKFYKV